MTPMKIFLSLKAWLEAEDALIERDDPFRHPDIRRMDLRQLADLPFPGRGRVMANEETAALAKCA